MCALKSSFTDNFAWFYSTGLLQKPAHGGHLTRCVLCPCIDLWLVSFQTQTVPCRDGSSRHNWPLSQPDRRLSLLHTRPFPFVCHFHSSADPLDNCYEDRLCIPVH